MRQLSVLTLVMAVCASAYADGGPAQAPANDFDLSVVMAQAADMAGAGGGKTDKSPFPPFDEVTKDMESVKGMFILWHYPDSARDKNQEKLLAQIPSSMLGQKFMLSTSFSGGGFFTGFPLDEQVVKWEVLDRQLLLIEPETSFVVDHSKEVADVVQRTYPDRIRAAVPIVTKSAGGDPVIDLGPLLKSNFADISWMSGGFLGGRGASRGGINRQLSKWIKKKAFELNVEIAAELAMGSYPPGAYEKKMVHYSFWKLPATNYSPREADDRVGYFLTTNRDWAKPTNSRDLFNRYVDRWHLEKRDPSLPLCEPKQPITFYIEKTVPIRFRRAVREGILEWNKAYEKVGFVNAVEVRQQTDDNEWKDLDPEDMRYSFFRWIVAGAGFAMGPHRANPFTGQIYDADIIFDDAMVRSFERGAERYLVSSAMAMKFEDPALEAFVEAFPQWKRPLDRWKGVLVGEDPHEEEVRKAMRKRLTQRGHHGCDYAASMKHQMAFARTMLEGQPQEVTDQFLYEVIKEVVMHEVGHTLGLRHNFKASTVYTLDEIRERGKKGLDTCGSVMDYNPVLFFADPDDDAQFVTTTIGPYDYWAIEYGYRPFDGKYKSHQDASSDQKPEDADETDAPKEPEAKLAGQFSLDQIPAEILEQMPPEMRDALAKTAASGVADGNGAAGSKPEPVAKPIAGESAMLKDIASRSVEPQLVYATDEDTTFISPDPRTNRFDMGADPIDWAETRLALIDKRMDDILKWSVKEGESWYHLRSAFQTLMFQRVLVLEYVGRYIGGQYFDRAHKSKGCCGKDVACAACVSPPFELVDPDTQRRAMAFLAGHVFSDDFFNVKPELLNYLAPSRWYHEGSYVSFEMDYAVHEMIALYQWWHVFDRIFPVTLRRIHDAELKSDRPDKLTLAEYLMSLQAACWQPTLSQNFNAKWTDAEPMISDVRRSLQREYLWGFEMMVRMPPGRILSPDIHAMLTTLLRDLHGTLAEKLADADGIDFASRAHLVTCKARIERVLAAELPEYGF